MKKKTSLILAFLLIFSMFVMTACGGGNSGKTANEPAKEEVEVENPFVGKWIAVAAQALGTTSDFSEISEEEYSFEIKDGGKAIMTMEGETVDGTWKADGNNVTLTFDDIDLPTVINGDVLRMDDFLGTGITAFYGREGTDAMNSANYLTEEESLIVGEWVATTVQEVLDDEPKTAMEGVDDIQNALRFNFKGDGNVNIIYKGNDLGDAPWSSVGHYITIESDSLDIMAEIDEDKLVAYVIDGANNYQFHLEKVTE